MTVPPTNAGIVVVTRDEGEQLRNTVDTLLRGVPDGTDIVVVDDGSTDGSTMWLDDHERVRVLRPSKRLGIANARNEGAAAVRGDPIIFSDAHVQPTEGWFEPLLAPLMRKEVGAVGPILTPLGESGVKVAGMTFVDQALNVAWLPRTGPDPVAVPLLCGCFMSMRRDVYESVGGFDSGMGPYGSEDLELCLRLWRLGYECRVVPEAEVAHRFRPPAPEHIAWDVLLHNLLRMGAIHLDPHPFAELIRSASGRPELPGALAAVAARDAGDRRERLALQSRRDTQSFFEQFGIRIFRRTRPSGPSEPPPRANGWPSTSGLTYREVNREAWSYWAWSGSSSSRPVVDGDFAVARAWLDPHGWIPWDEVETVLCLAAAGGQQAPLFASLGRRVTLLDLSPDQLELDRCIALERGLEIETIEADMLDLEALEDRRFDLVFQPVSACYVPDVRQLYGRVMSVLRPGGLYDVEHWNPVSMQLWRLGEWDGRAYRLVSPQRSGVAVPWDLSEELETDDEVQSWHYIHPLEDLIGGLCDSGFAIARFAERTHGDFEATPGSEEHRAAFAPPYLRVLARRPASNPQIRQPPPTQRAQRRQSSAGDASARANQIASLMDRPIVFVGGLHRSGTTLVARSLGAHPLVTRLHGTGVPEDEGQHLQDVYPPAAAHGGPGQFAFDPAAHLTEESHLVSAESRRRLLEAWAPFWDHGRTVLLEKSPPNLIRARFLRALLPQARFIMVVRHPAVVALATRKWRPGLSLDALLRHWFRAHELLEADLLRLDRVAVVKYEELVARPQAVLSGLTEWIGIADGVSADEVEPARSDGYREEWAASPAEELASTHEGRARHFGYSLLQMNYCEPFPGCERSGLCADRTSRSSSMEGGIPTSSKIKRRKRS
jgi:GT2 family glycosyltransferase/SAM-dependent methyltransferase